MEIWLDTGSRRPLRNYPFLSLLHVDVKTLIIMLCRNLLLQLFVIQRGVAER